MSNLVHGRFALVVPVHGPIGHSPRQDIAAVNGEVCLRELCGRIAIRHVGGQSAKAEQGAAGRHAGRGEICLEVDVQRIVGALPQSVLDARVVGAGGPGIVDRICCADQAELDICERVRSVELAKLDKKRMA